MKRTIPLILCVVLIVFTIASCCKAICSGSELRLIFVKYKHSDVDTVFLVRYRPNGQFNEPIDSLYSYTWYAAGPDSTLHLIEGRGLNTDLAIRIPAIGRAYRVTSITKRRQRCSCGGGSTEMVSAYKVDGVPMQQEDLILRQ